jgi:hypothetical protein
MPGLRKDKRARAPKRQPICGLFAVAMCAGRKLKTASDVQRLRDECRAAGLFRRRKGSWVGGTTAAERGALCAHFGLVYTDQTAELPAKTVGRLLKLAPFFQTRAKWLLCVPGHCLFVQTNKTKRRLFVMDQRGARMRLGDATAAMRKLVRRRVRSLVQVSAA